MGENNTEEIEFLAEAHGVVFPIKDFDYSDIELLSDEEIEEKCLEYMGTECNTLFIDTTKLPRKMRICFDEFGFDRVIVRWAENCRNMGTDFSDDDGLLCLFYSN